MHMCVCVFHVDCPDLYICVCVSWICGFDLFHGFGFDFHSRFGFSPISFLSSLLLSPFFFLLPSSFASHGKEEEKKKKKRKRKKKPRRHDLAGLTMYIQFVLIELY
ncbi:hypothetical protein CsSME_00048551 [Camellia sinensis var. sinensis]